MNRKDTYSSQMQHRLKATALGYDPDRDDSPRVLASGQGRIAEQIINLAAEKNIPIRKDPLLASALAQIEINDTIPTELYAVVAELLAYIYRIQKRRGEFFER